MVIIITDTAIRTPNNGRVDKADKIRRGKATSTIVHGSLKEGLGKVVIRATAERGKVTITATSLTIATRTQDTVGRTSTRTMITTVGNTDDPGMGTKVGGIIGTPPETGGAAVNGNSEWYFKRERKRREI